MELDLNSGVMRPPPGGKTSELERAHFDVTQAQYRADKEKARADRLERELAESNSANARMAYDHVPNAPQDVEDGETNGLIVVFS